MEIAMSTGVCNLLSINLVKHIKKEGALWVFDYESFKRAVSIAVRFSDNINDISRTPLPEYKASMTEKRRIGIGVLALGSLHYILGIRYGSRESIELIDNIFRNKAEVELITSAELGREKGSFIHFDKNEFYKTYWWKHVPISQDVKNYVESLGTMRNSHRSANAPTGNMSVYAEVVSGGIEPCFLKEYVRWSIVSEAARAGLREKGLIIPDIHKGEWFETDTFKSSKRGTDDILKGTFDGVEYEIDKNRGLIKASQVVDYGWLFVQEHMPEMIEEWDARGVFATTENLNVDDHVNTLEVIAKYTDMNSSKCVAKGTLIQTNKGVYPIEALGSATGKDVFSDALNGLKVRDENGDWKDITKHYSNGFGDTLIITMDTGEGIECSPNHQFKTMNGWVAAKHLTMKDLIEYRLESYDNELLIGGSLLPSVPFSGLANEKSFKTPTHMSVDLAKLLGMLAADGSTVLSSGAVALTSANNIVDSLYMQLFDNIFGIKPKITFDKRTKNTKSLVYNSRALAKWIRLLIGHGSLNKKVPNEILQGSKKEMIAFMEGVTLDGYVNKSINNPILFVYHGYSKELRDGIAAMVHMLGGIASKCFKKVVGGTSDYSYGVSVSNIDIMPIEPHKQINCKRKMIRYVKAPKIELLSHITSKHEKYSFARSIRQGCNVRVKASAMDALNIGYDGVYLSKIRKITPSQSEMFDIEVADTHSYLINGVVSHNTINVPADYPYEGFQQLYTNAWKAGIKGITTYRAGTMTVVLEKKEEVQEQKEELENFFEGAGDSVIIEDVELPDEYYSKGYIIRDNNRKKWYVNIAFADKGLSKPFALFVNTNSTEGTEVTDHTISSLMELANTKGIREELIVDQSKKFHNQTNVTKIARTIGFLLRHNVQLIDIVNILDEGSYPLSSFTFHIKRLLKQFIKDGMKVTGKDSDCPKCGGEMIFQEGCILCKDCSWSRCG